LSREGRWLRAAALSSLASACATAPLAPDQAAVLVNPTAESRAELLRVVREALHEAPLTLADDALTRESTLIVERTRPRGPDGTPLQGRDRERPEQFRLVKNGTSCVLVHEGSDRRVVLSSAHCAAR
jgi:hypothetical protein